MAIEDVPPSGAEEITAEQVESSLKSVTGGSLEPPSDVILVDQAYGTNTIIRGPRKGQTYKRPDLDPSAYNQGNTHSTRVWGIQWVPTDIITQLKLPLYGEPGEDYGDEYVFGDIFVAFARRSKVQSHSLYVYRRHRKSTWESFSNSKSLGKYINNILGDGIPFNESMGNRYRYTHPSVPDSGWIFGSSYMAMWATTRPVSTAGSLTSIEFIESVFGE